MTAPPPRGARVAALAREIAPLLTDPASAPAVAGGLDALVAAVLGVPASEATPLPGPALRDAARDHALLFAPLLPLDPAALALAAALGPAAGWRRFREPRPIDRDEAAAWERLEAAFAPVMRAIDARLGASA